MVEVYTFFASVFIQYYSPENTCNLSWQLLLTCEVSCNNSIFFLLVVKNWSDGVTGCNIKNCCLAGVASCKVETILLQLSLLSQITFDNNIVRSTLARLRIYHFLILASVFDEELCLPRNFNNLNLKLTGSHGTLQSPVDYYIPGIKCEWLITVPEGKAVELKVDRFKLPPKHPSLECLYNSFQVYDGKDGESLGTYCGDVVPEPLKSSGRYMRVRFTSDTEYQAQYPGFKATFNAVDKRSKLKAFKSRYDTTSFLV